MQAAVEIEKNIKRRNKHLLPNTTNNTTIYSLSSPKKEYTTSTFSKPVQTEEPKKTNKKIVFEYVKPRMVVDESTSKVPRMVQIIQHNEEVKEHMRLNSWKYNDIIPPKKQHHVSDFEMLLVAKFYPDELNRYVQKSKK